MSTAPTRFVTLDAMRGIAALAVMVHHFTIHSSSSLLPGAGVAVDLFFCLSGFVIAHSYLERLQGSMSIGEFLARRLVRLYPMFLCGLALGSVALLAKVAAGQTSLGFAQAGTAIVANALYLPYWADFHVQIGVDKVPSPAFPTNDPAWSLFFELGANIVFAVVVALAIGGRRLPHVVLTVLGALGLLWWMQATGRPAPGWGVANLLGGVPRVAWGFFAGVVVWFAFRRYGTKLPAIQPLWLLVLVPLLFVKGSARAWVFTTLLLVPAFVLLGAASAAARGRLQAAGEYLGWISYPVYCLHFPIYLLFTTVTGSADHRLWALAVCTPITLLLAHVLTRHVEEPVRASLSARLFRRRAASSTGAA